MISAKHGAESHSRRFEAMRALKHRAQFMRVPSTFEATEDDTIMGKTIVGVRIELQAIRDNQRRSRGRPVAPLRSEAFPIEGTSDARTCLRDPG